MSQEKSKLFHWAKTGVLFVLPRLRRWPSQWASRILVLASSSLFVEMLVAVYVHLQASNHSSVRRSS